MRADDDVDRAGVDAGDRVGNFLLRAEARQFDDLHRPVGEAVTEGREVLLGEQGGRAQHGDLLAAGHGDERGAQCDLGLAEADVAAHQPVHREAGAHVLDDRVDRRLLVGCFLEPEAFGEGFVVARLELEGVALARGAQRVEVEQLGGRVADLLRRLLLRLVPIAAAQLVQRCGVGIGAAVAADQVQLCDRDVELGVVGVLQMEELARAAVAELERLEPEVAADAVFDVDNRVAHTQLREVADHRFDVARALPTAAAQATRACRIELGLGQDRDARVGQDEAAVHRSDAERQRSVARQETVEVGRVCRRDSVLGEHLGHRFAASGGVGQDQRAAAELRQKRAQPRQRILGLPRDRDVGHRGEALGRAIAERDAREGLARDEELLGIEIEPFRRQTGTLRVLADEPEAVLRLPPEALTRVLDRPVQHQHAVVRQVVEQGGGRVEEQGQVVLDARVRHAEADVLVERRARRIALEGLAPAVAERGAARLVEGKLPAGQDADVADRIQRALRVRIEGLDRVDALVEQVEAKRQPCAHREHVEQAAADRELAGGDHLRDVLVTGQHELRAQAFREQAFALAEEERVAGDVAGGRKPLQRGRRRHDQDVERSVGRTLVVVRQAIQGLETLRHQILVRRQDVVGQGFPVRKRAHRQLGANQAISSTRRCASSASAHTTTASRPPVRKCWAWRASSSASPEPGGRAMAKRSPAARRGIANWTCCFTGASTKRDAATDRVGRRDTKQL